MDTELTTADTTDAACCLDCADTHHPLTYAITYAAAGFIVASMVKQTAGWFKTRKARKTTETTELIED